MLDELSLIDSIRKITTSRANSFEDSLDSLELFLRSWWSKTYNRPLKDPILDSYHVYELVYEYFDKIDRQKASETLVEQENDRIEDNRIQETLDWIAEEERLEAEQRAQEKQTEEDNQSQDEGWMIEQLKKQYGDDFGDDINLSM